MIYKKKIEVSQEECTSKAYSENLTNFEGQGKGYTPLATATVDSLEAWRWATYVAHTDAQADYTWDAFQFFFLWNTELYGV